MISFRAAYARSTDYQPRKRHARRRSASYVVKTTTVPREGELGHLRWLTNELGDDLLDAVVITKGRDAYRRPDGIAVVPAALLGP